MISFDPKKFQEQNQKAKDGVDFDDVERGKYEAFLKRLEFVESTKLLENGFPSKSVQLKCGWQISKDDPHFPSQYVWTQQNVKNKEGEDNEVGIQQLCYLLNSASEGMFDEVAFVQDPKMELTKFIDTKAIIDVNYKVEKYEGKDQKRYTVKIDEVLENKYQQLSPELEETQQTSSKPTEEVKPEDDYDDVEVEIGMRIVFEHTDGHEYFADIDGFTELGDKQVIILTPVNEKKKDGKAFPRPLMVEANKCRKVDPNAKPLSMQQADAAGEVEDEEILDEDETPTAPKLEKGSDVSYMFEGKEQKTKVHEINEDEGWVKVIAVVDGKKVARKLSLEAVSPF